MSRRIGASAAACVSTSNVPLGRLNAGSTTRWTAADKYGARRRAAAWRAGDHTRIGNARGLPGAGPIRVGSPTTPARTPTGHRPVGAGSDSGEAATGARNAGAAAGLASAAPALAASQLAATNTAIHHRAGLPGLTVRYTIAASLS